MVAEKEYIVLYRTLLEEKLMLGSSAGKLKQREFEYLAKLIEEKSRVRLSVSTLKRLWKDDFTQLPHPATLDALVSILGFKDWQNFKKEYAEKSDHQRPKEVTWGRKGSAVPLLVSLGVVIVIAGFFILQGFNKSVKKLSLPEKIPFTADKTVTSGVPNTVMFNYDLKNVQADSFFIQQSWNPRNKVKIDPAKNYLSSIYYTPGFHRAKLIVNDSVVSIARVHVKTDGWLPIVQYDIRDNHPLYLDKKSVTAQGYLHTPLKVLEAAQVEMNKTFYLRYYNIRDFDGIDSDNFAIETRLKHDGVGNILCPFAELTILTEEHIFYVPLTSKGCIGELGLKIGEVYESGKDNDLSALGTDIYDWQVLRIRNEQKNAIIFLNGAPVHDIQYKGNFGKIVGIIYTFNGPGSVDFIRIRNVKGEMVYEDEF